MIDMILLAWEKALMRSVLATPKHERKRGRVVWQFKDGNTWMTTGAFTDSELRGLEDVFMVFG